MAIESEQTSSSTGAPLDQSRLLLDKQGRLMYLGDSANPSFLQSIRRLVRETQGPGPFVDDPLRPCMVEASPDSPPGWQSGAEFGPAPLPLPLSEQEAAHFAKQYQLCTNGILQLFDEAVVLFELPLAIAGGCATLPLAYPVVYLILAIGAQSSPKDYDQHAEAYFNQGRQFAAQRLMEDPSTTTVEAYLLITMYLLAASRRNAAFMHLGFAVRAAYALGLHLQGISSQFPAEEAQRRERIWKSLRSLDILLSAMLGRPPSSRETRNTRSLEGYSASNDLMSIMEDILTNVYERRQITALTLNRVATRQREWAAVFFQGLSADEIEPRDILWGSNMLNTGLTHLKVVFHWTVMLLTRPFLSEKVAAHARHMALGMQQTGASWTPPESSRILANACVNSAVRTLTLLKPLADDWNAPKCLPFSVACIVHSALVIGLAHFGDMDQVFPLDRYMHTARTLLRRFSSDPIAFRNSTIIQLLHETCQSYTEKKQIVARNIDDELLSSLFGHFQYSPTACSNQDLDQLFKLAGCIDTSDNVTSLIDVSFDPDSTINVNLDPDWIDLSGSGLFDVNFGPTLINSSDGTDFVDTFIDPDLASQSSWESMLPPSVHSNASDGAVENAPQAVQLLSPAAIPATVTQQDDGIAVHDADVDFSRILDVPDNMNLDSHVESVSLHALMDECKDFFGLE